VNKAFILAALERALKTAAQALLSLWIADQGFDILKVNLEHSFGVAATAFVLSVLTSIVSAGAGNSGPSLATEQVAPPQ
jgi:hypothetical protein